MQTRAGETGVCSSQLQWLGLTGLPRSGTTFVATALTASPRVAYLHEPFNPSCGILGIDWNCTELVDRSLTPREPIADAVTRLLSLRGRLRKHAPASDGAARRVMKRVVGGRGPVELAKARWLRPWITHGVLKDPVGFYMFPYLQERFAIPTAVVVKHPTAAYAGLNRVGWHSGIDFLRNRRYLRPHLTQDERRLLDRPTTSPAEIVAIQWRVTYGLLTRWARERGWRVVVIEEVSENPVVELERLAQELELPWDERSRRRVQSLTNPSNSAVAKNGRVQALSRDSRRVFQAQVARVDRADRRVIYDITHDLALNFYSDSTFGLD